MLIFEIIAAVFIFVQGIFLFVKGVSVSGIEKIIYAIFGLIAFLSFTILLSHIAIWESLSRIKKQIRLRANPEAIKEIITEEVKKQMPDTDRVFKFFGWFISVVIFIFTVLIAVVIYTLSLTKLTH